MMMCDITNKGIQVKKPESDDREYECLILANELKILLVSDPTTEKGAVAVNVNVGYLSDPDLVPGIAHFCEHMVIIGKQFNEFLSQNGGYFNACTSEENTIYSFDVKSEALLSALDSFAAFFVSPTLSESTVDGEMNAINSEHDKNILDDQWRRDYISKCTSRPGHVYQKFGTGNIESLKIIPQEKNINIKELLLEFHSKYYSSNITTIAVLGKEPLGELKDVVVPLFVNLDNKEVELLPCNEYPYGNNELGVMLKIATIKDIKCLALIFQLPDLSEHYKTKPWKYIAHLIGHEGEGSLLMYLKKKKLWVNTLSAGIKPALKGCDFFYIDISLTDDGLQHIYDIIEVCFQYINMLKRDELQLEIYKELQVLNEIDFQFKDKKQPVSYVSQLSTWMHWYEPEDIVYGSSRMDLFLPEKTSEILSNINPSNFRCYIQSKTFEGKTDKVAKYYDAGYCIEKIPDELIEKWKKATPNPELHLKNKNMFIPESLDIVVPKENKEIKGIPSLIKDNRYIRVWYKADDTFFLPKSYFKLLISSPVANMSPAHMNNLSMYMRLIKDELVEFACDTEIAGLNYQIKCDNRGLIIQMDGFNSKQLLLLDKILHHITKLDVKEEVFDVNKVRLMEDLRNGALNEPYRQDIELWKYLFVENWWSDDEKLEYMEELDVNSLKSFICEFKKSIYMEALCCGNLLINDVEEIYGVIEKYLIKEGNAKPMLPSQHLLPREYKLPKSSNYLFQKRSEIHANSCVLVYYQVGLKEKRLNVLCELFSQIIKAPFFNTLRTEQQLGYIVFSDTISTISVRGILVLIQSDKCPSLVFDRIEEFFTKFEETLVDMSEEHFKEYVEAIAVQKLEKPKNLLNEASMYWMEVFEKHYNYRRNMLEVEELRNLTKANIVQFFRSYISPFSKNRKMYTGIILGKDVESVIDDNKSWQVIDDVLKFKSRIPLYPHVMPHEGVSLLSNTK